MSSDERFGLSVAIMVTVLLLVVIVSVAWYAHERLQVDKVIAVSGAAPLSKQVGDAEARSLLDRLRERIAEIEKRP